MSNNAIEHQQILNDLRINNILLSGDLILLEHRDNPRTTITIKELRQLAKQRGLTGYSNMNKAALAKFIIDSKREREIDRPNVSLLDTPIPNVVKDPLLTPRKSPTVEKLKNKCSKVVDDVKKRFKDKIKSIAEWIKNISVPASKNVNEKLETLKAQISKLFKTKHLKNTREKKCFKWTLSCVYNRRRCRWHGPRIIRHCCQVCHN